MLVNNAGAAMSGTLGEADPDRLEQMIRLNVVAPTRLAAAVRAAVHRLRAWHGRQHLFRHCAGAGVVSRRLQRHQGFPPERQPEAAGGGRGVGGSRPGGAAGSGPHRDLGEVRHRHRHASGGQRDGGGGDGRCGAGRSRRRRSRHHPSLPDAADWDAWHAARRAMLPNLSRRTPAPRYRTRAAKAAGGQ